MKPLDLKEFAEELRRKGVGPEIEFATEILDLLDLEEEVAEPFNDVCTELDHYAPESLTGRPQRQAEWLGDRANLLTEIEEQFRKAKRDGDIDDVVRDTLDELANIETILRKYGGWSEGDLQDALFALIERADKAPKLKYDL